MSQTSQIFRLTNLETEKIGYKLWRVTRPLMFSTPVGLLTVPVGFITDGASCPGFLYTLCPPMAGSHVESAVLHDFLYSKDSDDDAMCSRKAADLYFLNAMIANGTGKMRAKTIYYGVRAGGKGSYKKCYSNEKIKE